MGRLRLMSPRTLALRTVQRQTAASRSASPLIRLQQGSFGGTPSLRASMGHLPPKGIGVFGVGNGLGLGLGLCGEGQFPALTREKKSRFRARKRAADDCILEAMTTHYGSLLLHHYGICSEM
ncbi:unnamed protein product [Spirodela intermedia]|uniref:Uncharacterized protein n=1 Tax=Spirodela intermedia TaxID=51605 RepID=A0A7I8L307_SPIIN|nr:unnamed protein product [Spirodela intermedia]